MKITKEAIALLSNIVFSCDPIGKQKDEKNENFIAQCAKKEVDFDFDEFCKGLLDGTEREEKIRALAISLGKQHIDYETICVYFGGASHTQKTLADLSREGVAENTKFSLYVILIHLLVPVVIQKMDLKSNNISVSYENEGISMTVDGILYAPRDEKRLHVGSYCLVHYPFVVDVDPDEITVQTLKNLQLKDENFLKACGYFKKVGLDHSRFIYYQLLKKRL